MSGIVGDTFELVDAPGQTWEVTAIGVGERGATTVLVVRLESGKRWAYEALDRLLSGGGWRRVSAPRDRSGLTTARTTRAPGRRAN